MAGLNYLYGPKPPLLVKWLGHGSEVHMWVTYKRANSVITKNALILNIIIHVCIKHTIIRNDYIDCTWLAVLLKSHIESTVHITFTDYGHSGCGGAGILTHTTGVVEAPSHYNGHTHYQPDSHCTWKIHASAGKVVRLSGISFHIEDDSKYNYVN